MWRDIEKLILEFCESNGALVTEIDAVPHIGMQGFIPDDDGKPKIIDLSIEALARFIACQ
jgi:hypothetical protein